MHDFGFLVPIAIVAIVFGSHTFRIWIRAKQRQIMLLSNENEKLTGQVSRLEERIAVLERIATDPATRTAAEIEALRDR